MKEINKIEGILRKKRIIAKYPPPSNIPDDVWNNLSDKERDFYVAYRLMGMKKEDIQRIFHCTERTLSRLKVKLYTKLNTKKTAPF